MTDDPAPVPEAATAASAPGTVPTREPGPAAESRPAGRFRRWRRSRPFWGGLLTMVAGAEIAMVALTAYTIILVSPSVAIAATTGFVVVILGLVSWLTPSQNKLYGLLAALGGVVSFVTSNLGGFLVGGLLAIVGGALIFAWEPGASPAASGAHVAGSEGSSSSAEVTLDSLLTADASPSDGVDGPEAAGAPA